MVSCSAAQLCTVTYAAAATAGLPQHALVRPMSSARPGEPNTLSDNSKQNAVIKTKSLSRTDSRQADRPFSWASSRLTVVIRFGKFRLSRQNQAELVRHALFGCEIRVTIFWAVNYRNGLVSMGW